MPDIPRTEAGYNMPMATLYHLQPALADGVADVVITSNGVYQADPMGQIRDFWDCLYQGPALDSHRDALRHIGYELKEGEA